MSHLSTSRLVVYIYLTPIWCSGLGGTRKPKSSIIYETFQGQVEVTSLTRKKVVMSSSDQNSSAISDHNNSAGGDGNSFGSKSAEENDLMRHNSSSTKTVSIVDTVQEDEDSGVRMEERWIQEQVVTPFLFLSLDIPPTPLFKVLLSSSPSLPLSCC